MEVRFICNTCKKQVINKIHPNYPHAINAAFDIGLRVSQYLVNHRNHDIQFITNGMTLDCWEVTEEDL